MEQPARSTYRLVDAENLDTTLGNSVLGAGRPTPAERPGWERVRDWAVGAWDQPVKGLFFLNASSGQLPLSFVQALLALDYRPIPLSGAPGEKVVDIGIKRTLDALADRPGDVLLASHDGDFLPQLEPLLGNGRRVGIIGFREFVNAGYPALAEQGLEIFDLEEDVKAFTTVLPRVLIIPLVDFDPLRYL